MDANNRIYYFGEIVTIFLLVFSSFLFVFEVAPLPVIHDIQLVLCLFIIIFNYCRVRSFNIYQIWIMAYIFIVWAEMRISSTSAYIIPYIRFTLSNCFVLFGYHSCQGRRNSSQSKIYYISKTNWTFTFSLVIFYVLYILLSANSALVNIQSGRQLSDAKGSTTFSGVWLSALGTILPALIAYYLKYLKGKKNIVSFIVCLPIFIIVLLQSTRFRFLFTVLPYLIVVDLFSLGKSNLKKNFILLFCAILMIGVSTFVKENRNVAFLEIEKKSLFENAQTNDADPFTLKLAKNMSSEGVVYMSYVADDYFSTHSLHWGKELSFIMYFWVPRAIWPNKPTQLDYWLIREYSSETVAGSYSSASGFIGEARADFGWGCLMFAFLIGMLFRRIDGYKAMICNECKNSFNIVLVAILVPWVFFFVRSPLTSTMSLIWELLIYYLFVRLFAMPSSSEKQ